MDPRPFYSQNRLLHGLSGETLTRLAPELERVTLAHGSTLGKPDCPPEFLHFPINSMVSLTSSTRDRGITQVSMVGNEGVLDVSLFLGGTSTNTAVVQAAGSALRMRAAHVMREFSRNGDFMRILLRYTHALINQIAQSAVCNRVHTIDQQVCRWLLEADDRVPDDTIEITHGTIAHVLGVRREGVTAAAGKLKARGAIACRRGQVVVLDRGLLERLSCECYGAVKRENARLFPADRGWVGAPREHASWAARGRPPSPTYASASNGSNVREAYR